MPGHNALPHGILGEFSRCRLWENAQDDTWRDKFEEGKPEVLFEWTNIYTRDLLAHCQNATHVANVNPEECCVSGNAGLICYYISGTLGDDHRLVSPDSDGPAPKKTSKKHKGGGGDPVMQYVQAPHVSGKEQHMYTSAH